MNVIDATNQEMTMSVSTLVKREEVIKTYSPLEHALLETFQPITKYKYPGQFHVKDGRTRGTLNSLIITLERTLRGPLPQNSHPDAEPLEQATQTAEEAWAKHLKQFQTPAQAKNDPRTPNLLRTRDFCQTRFKAVQVTQNALKLVFFQLFGEAWEPSHKKHAVDDTSEYDTDDALKEYFDKVPEVKTAVIHGISGGARVLKAAAKRR